MLGLGELLRQAPCKKPVLIDGLLRIGETANIIAAPKMGKSFLSLNLALSVAMGCPWMGFPTAEGRVLLIDNELHRETLADRVARTAEAMGIETADIDGQIDILCLRGCNLDIVGLGLLLAQFQPGAYRLVVLDALYRLLPAGTSENDNAGMMAIYNQVDRYAAQMGAAFAIIHHTSKGDQAGKEVTDLGAGAGAISRAADTHLTIRPHESQGLAVLEAVTRSFQSPEPRTVEFSYPLWRAVDEIQPAVRNPRLRASQAAAEARAKTKADEDTNDINQILAQIPAKGIGQTDLQNLVGFGVGKFRRLIGKARSEYGAIEIKTVKRAGSKKKLVRITRKYLTVQAALEARNPEIS